MCRTSVRQRARVVDVYVDRLTGSLLGRLRIPPARNGGIIRGASIIDVHDREVIAWRAVVNAGISGSDVCDMMLEAVEARFGAIGRRIPSICPPRNR